MRKANTRLRKIDDSIYSTDNNPGIYAYRQAGKPKDFFKFTKGMNKFQRNRVTKEAQKFLKSRTSTKKGSRKVLKQTVKNILGGGSHMSESDIQKYNDFDVIITQPDLGASLVESYFDVYYKVKDLLSSSHVYAPSNDIMKAITTEVEEKKSIIKNTTDDIKITQNSEGMSILQFNEYLDLMDSAELAKQVVEDLM